MTNAAKWLGLMALCSVTAFAASPAGTLLQSRNVQLSGVKMPSAGVASWPVLEGDEVETDQQAALVMLEDGTRITLGKKSRAVFRRVGGQLQVQLLSGGLLYRFLESSDSQPTILLGNQPARLPGEMSGALFVADDSEVNQPQIAAVQPTVPPSQNQQRSPNCAAIDQPPVPRQRSPCSPNCVGPDCVGSPSPQP